VSRLWRDHRDRRQDHRHRLWSLVMLELWFRQFVDGDSARRPGRADEAGARRLQPGDRDISTLSNLQPSGEAA
jgi:hypothetical protein